MYQHLIAYKQVVISHSITQLHQLINWVQAKYFLQVNAIQTVNIRNHGILNICPKFISLPNLKFLVLSLLVIYTLEINCIHQSDTMLYKMKIMSQIKMEILLLEDLRIFQDIFEKFRHNSSLQSFLPYTIL